MQNHERGSENNYAIDHEKREDLPAPLLQEQTNCTIFHAASCQTDAPIIEMLYMLKKPPLMTLLLVAPPSPPSGRPDMFQAAIAKYVVPEQMHTTTSVGIFECSKCNEYVSLYILRINLPPRYTDTTMQQYTAHTLTPHPSNYPPTHSLPFPNGTLKTRRYYGSTLARAATRFP